MAEQTDPNKPIPFFAFGNLAVGVIAVGNAAFGVVAIGASLSCGVVAIGMNSVGVLAFGLNAAGPAAFALINAIGVVVGALVNAFGGVGACLLNEAVTPILGIALAVVFFAIGTKLAKTRPESDKPDPKLQPLDRFRELAPGSYTTRATLQRDDDRAMLEDGDVQLAVELGEGRVAAKGAELVAFAAYFENLDGEYCELAVEVVDEFETDEGDYRSAPDKKRRFILQDGRAIRRTEWTRARLAYATGRWTQLASIATGGLCIVASIT